jgi:hypothetical protein
MEHQPPKVNEPEPEQDKPEYSDEHPYAEGLNQLLTGLSNVIETEKIVQARAFGWKPQKNTWRR